MNIDFFFKERYVRQAHSLKVVAINLSPQSQPKAQLLAFIIPIKYSYLGKLQFVCSWKSLLNDLDGYRRNGYAILYECTALTS